VATQNFKCFEPPALDWQALLAIISIANQPTVAPLGALIHRPTLTSGAAPPPISTVLPCLLAMARAVSRWISASRISLSAGVSDALMI
jgi:hypothetical protein